MIYELLEIVFAKYFCKFILKLLQAQKASWKLAVPCNAHCQERQKDDNMTNNNLSTNFSDTTGAGQISLYENPFKNGVKYYGKFNRTVVDVSNLIARLEKNVSGKNLIVVEETIKLVKKEIIDALSRGETVSFGGLGTFYIAPICGFESTSDTGSDVKLTVKFLPSAELKASVKNVKIKKSDTVDTSPTIENITDGRTGKSFDDDDFALTAGMNVVVTGTRLKVAGENSGVFLAPVDAQDALVSDEGQWLKSDRIARNLPKTLDFYLPSTAKAGTKYRIVIRTSYSKSSVMLKKHIDVVSGVVTVKAAV